VFPATNENESNESNQATTAYAPIEKAPFDRATAEAAGKQEQIKFEKQQSDIRQSSNLQLHYHS
jgi:hypothetical protein